MTSKYSLSYRAKVPNHAICELRPGLMRSFSMIYFAQRAATRGLAGGR